MHFATPSSSVAVSSGWGLACATNASSESAATSETPAVVGLGWVLLTDVVVAMLLRRDARPQNGRLPRKILTKG